MLFSLFLGYFLTYGGPFLVNQVDLGSVRGLVHSGRTMSYGVPLYPFIVSFFSFLFVFLFISFVLFTAVISHCCQAAPSTGAVMTRSVLFLGSAVGACWEVVRVW